MTAKKPLPVPLLGAHMSIAGGTPRAIDRALEVKANVSQIFVKNNNRWVGKELRDEEVELFRRRWRESGLGPIVAHSAYLINLASPQPLLWRRSIRAMLEELDRCRRLGLSHLVTHPGAHCGEGEKWGVKRVARALDRIHRRARGCNVKIALEATAGQGTHLGYRFEHLRDILAESRFPSRIEICLDTCHLFAAGYDVRTRETYESTLEAFCRGVGLPKLAVLNLNDSKRDLASRVDRHEHIGKGMIGLESFGLFVRDPRLAQVPKILETPKGQNQEGDLRNLRLLKRLAKA